jgi:hypothetical protein
MTVAAEAPRTPAASRPASFQRPTRRCAREQRAKLDPTEQRWHELCEQSRKVIGCIHPFTPADLPEGDFTKAPFPSAESLTRNGVTIPAPVKTPPAPDEAVEPEHT